MATESEIKTEEVVETPTEEVQAASKFAPAPEDDSEDLHYLEKIRELAPTIVEPLVSIKPEGYNSAIYARYAGDILADELHKKIEGTPIPLDA